MLRSPALKVDCARSNPHSSGGTSRAAVAKSYKTLVETVGPLHPLGGNFRAAQMPLLAMGQMLAIKRHSLPLEPIKGVGRVVSDIRQLADTT